MLDKSYGPVTFNWYPWIKIMRILLLNVLFNVRSIFLVDIWI